MTTHHVLPRTVVFLLVALAWARPLAAQGSTTGGIRGQVAAGPNQPLAEAEVVAVNDETGLRRGGVTDADDT